MKQLSYNSQLQNNNADLQSILDSINALPESGSGEPGKAVPVYIVVRSDEDGNYSVDGSYSDITQAYSEGCLVYAVLDETIRLPIVACTDTESNFVVNVGIDTIMLTIYEDGTANKKCLFPDMQAEYGEPGYIHNRTHSARTVNNPRVFNGDLFGKTSVNFAGAEYVLASRDVLTVDDLVGVTMVTMEYGEEKTYTLTEADLSDRGSEGEYLKYIEICPTTFEGKPIAICAYDVCSSDGGESGIDPGVYYLYVEETFYVRVINYLPIPGELEEQVVPLHPKFLPDRRMFGEYELSCTCDDNGKVTWNKTIREIDVAYRAGYYLKASTTSGAPMYLLAAVPGEIYIFLGIEEGVASIVFLTRQQLDSQEETTDSSTNPQEPEMEG